jgi:hypothetical protein
MKGALTARALVTLLLDVTRIADVTYAQFACTTLAQITRRGGASGAANSLAFFDGQSSAAKAVAVIDPFGAAVLAATNRFISLRDLWTHFVTHGIAHFADNALACKKNAFVVVPVVSIVAKCYIAHKFN